MHENIIAWTVPNFITVGVMGAVMFTLFGLIGAWYKRQKSGS